MAVHDNDLKTNDIELLELANEIAVNEHELNVSSNKLQFIDNKIARHRNLSLLVCKSVFVNVNQ